jgi:hypothetical protein
MLEDNCHLFLSDHYLFEAVLPFAGRVLLKEFHNNGSKVTLSHARDVYVDPFKRPRQVSSALQIVRNRTSLVIFHCITAHTLIGTAGPPSVHVSLDVTPVLAQTPRQNG